MPLFIHTADWQIGRQYSQFAADDAVPIAEARIDTVLTIARLASDQRADAVLVAGDVFDAQTVSDKTIRRLFNAMSGFAGPWILIPGNHDAALAESVWTRAQRLGAVAANVHLSLQPETLVFASAGFAVLTAPLTQRHTYNDLTAWFDSAETPAGLLRIGMAHGAVQGILAPDIDSANPIAPDRTERARLDYLALGDWHGCKQIDARTWYSGTPETDRFRANEPGFALRVQIDAPGVPPQVEPLQVGRYRWSQSVHVLAVASDADAVVARLADLDDSDVAQIALQGETDLHSLERIKAALSQAEARARSLSVDFDALRLLPTDEDILALNADGYLGDVIATLRDRQGGVEPQVATQALALLTTLLAERRAASKTSGGTATQGATA